jgi:hypothetical protein
MESVEERASTSGSGRKSVGTRAASAGGSEPKRLALRRGHLGALALAAVLAGCGGGGGGGGGDGPQPGPAPQPCASQVGGGSGYSVAACLNPMDARYLPTETTVDIRGEASYLLTLNFPGDQPAGADTSVDFTASNRTTTVTENSRDILGVLRGEAYESPLNATLTPPFTALTEFGRALDYQSGSPLINLRYVGFGHWERVLSSFNDSYFGVWYAPRPGTSAVNDWPTGARQYSGRVVGVLTPTRQGGDTDFEQSYGFSATITLQVDASGRIQSGAVENAMVSFRTDESQRLIIDPLLVNPIQFTQAGDNTPGGPVTGTLDAPGPQVTGTGEFEAQWFGEQASPGSEIGGRMRLTAAGGHYLVIGSFGASAVSP